MTNPTTQLASLAWSIDLHREIEPGSGTTAVENTVSQLLAGELDPMELERQGSYSWYCVELPAETHPTGRVEVLVVEASEDPDGNLHVHVRLGAMGSEPIMDSICQTVSQ